MDCWFVPSIVLSAVAYGIAAASVLFGVVLRGILLMFSGGTRFAGSGCGLTDPSTR